MAATGRDLPRVLLPQAVTLAVRRVVYGLSDSDGSLDRYSLLRPNRRVTRRSARCYFPLRLASHEV